MQRVGSCQQVTQGGRPGPRQAYDALRKSSREEGDRDLALYQPVAQPNRGNTRLLVRQIDTGADGEIGPQLPNRRIKAWTSELCGSIGRRDGERALMPKDKIQQ